MRKTTLISFIIALALILAGIAAVFIVRAANGSRFVTSESEAQEIYRSLSAEFAEAAQVMGEQKPQKNERLVVSADSLSRVPSNSRGCFQRLFEDKVAQAELFCGESGYAVVFAFASPDGEPQYFIAYAEDEQLIPAPDYFLKRIEPNWYSYHISLD